MRGADYATIAAALALAGCNLAPDYAPPQVAAPAAYGNIGPWAPAAPADTASRGPWWAQFADPVLDDLEQRIETASPQLAAALARYDQARAYRQQARSELFPEIGAQASAERDRVSARRPLAGTSGAQRYNDYVVGASASYELDLWGRVRNMVSAGRANEQASAADLANVRLSLQAELADDYFRMRGLDAETALLEATVDAYQRAFKLTDARHSGGASSGLDVGRAQTQLSSARAQLAEVAAERALLEHAIAALVGENASSFTIARATTGMAQPRPVPVGAPSTLLQRRPDIAAAERRMAAANARIGMQKAAFFPTISLGLAGGYETTGGDLLSKSTSFWALGPAAAVLSLFDGGRRRAAVAVARGEFDEAAANYRQTVLDAFRAAEDQMTLANRLAESARDQAEAVKAAEQTNRLALIRYREGAADYLEVVTSQTAELEAKRTALDIRTRRLQANVDLIRAFGGGWDGMLDPPNKGRAAAAPTPITAN